MTDSTQTTAHRIADSLLTIGAVFLRPQTPFTWASGIQSPIYCDNRLTLSYPAVRKEVEQGLADLIRQHYPEAEVIAGTSTAGIAHAALVADILDLPMIYVRGSAKAHGRQSQIEGFLAKGQNVVVIEDLISTAKSVLEVVAVLKEFGANVLGIASIFTYGMQHGIERLQAAQTENHSLSNYDVLLEVALSKGLIAAHHIKALRAFRDHPQDGSWMDQLSE